MEKRTGFIFDVDGVITDGNVYISESGMETKKVNMKDIDAIYELHRQGYFIAAVTAEKNAFSEWVSKRFPWDAFYSGISEKGSVLDTLREEFCDYIIYIGDGRKDLDAFARADFKVCPKDAIKEIRMKANRILRSPAGCGGLWELTEIGERLKKGRERKC